MVVNDDDHWLTTVQNYLGGGDGASKIRCTGRAGPRREAPPSCSYHPVIRLLLPSYCPAEVTI